MHKLSILAGIALASLAAHARAADLPVKAPTVVPVSWGNCVPQNCSGWYAGFGILGDGANSDIQAGGVSGSVFAMGGALKLQGGYQLWYGSWFAAIEASVGYEFTTRASVNIDRSGSRFIGTELVKLGYNFFPSTEVGSPVSGQSPVPLTVPANLLASSTPYLAFGGLQRRGLNEWVTGVGVQTVIAKGWATDVKYLHAPSQQGEPATSIVMFELNKHF